MAGLLTQSLAAGHILLMHDGNSARTADGRPVVLEVFALANVLLVSRYDPGATS